MRGLKQVYRVSDLLLMNGEKHDIITDDHRDHFQLWVGDLVTFEVTKTEANNTCSQHKQN